MEKEITYEIRIKIFAQYLGADFRYNGSVGTIRKLEGMNWKWDAEDRQGESYNVDKCRLILKPLQSITDEDAKKLISVHVLNSVDHILNIYEKEIKNGMLSIRHSFGGAYYTHFVSIKDMSRKEADLLRSLGYAVDYMDWSVEDLVKAGIYTLDKLCVQLIIVNKEE